MVVSEIDQEYPAEIQLAFHALGEPLRLKVIEILHREELCVCDLCDRLHLTPSKLSFHLQALRRANLVLSRQEGRWVYYRLNRPQFEVLMAYLQQFTVGETVLARICS
ncbi:metalloregulator ArsR/SmtB family transcription factor [Thermosynechococcus sp. QKsg1]|uniref:ArsR/SmtB family transcription factor n=1 Tax=unclassified Thermosynechococcus TaxID=2622553 RepID=UPI00122DC6AB|nr:MULTISPECIES: metalloregulator ArsR/SmtB family transcription factor [unclassified Thermosynechococcus]QEQ00701.1 winged helix-turn-helix transcriptional regulator [Thermosynechococcus sp. CL-1]WJI24943.1 metalloregulator ArsR/SmtB family transcription factor [Thermosynechococcus sp. B0]WJI27463.1 metalloregulator ArsR/SmtB family transcription factor [Thermosynechococcus sp. B1]WJI29995.1 metalloregulator ArsR/SmtB family transcription factor [Thermosynechococcus sp. B3]WKT84580.1 metallor